MKRGVLIGFIKKNYCDIEATELPKTTGALPSKERLLKRKQVKKLIKKAEWFLGEEFAEFLKMNFVKTSVTRGKKKIWFFWLNFSRWDYMFQYWQKYEQTSLPETPPPDYFID